MQTPLVDECLVELGALSHRQCIKGLRVFAVRAKAEQVSSFLLLRASQHRRWFSALLYPLSLSLFLFCLSMVRPACILFEFRIFSSFLQHSGRGGLCARMVSTLPLTQRAALYSRWSKTYRRIFSQMNAATVYVFLCIPHIRLEVDIYTGSRCSSSRLSRCYWYFSYGRVSSFIFQNDNI